MGTVFKQTLAVILATVGAHLEISGSAPAVAGVTTEGVAASDEKDQKK